MNLLLGSNPKSLLRLFLITPEKRYVIILSFPCFLGEKQGKPPKKARIFPYAEPLKSLGKKGKTLKKARKFLATKKARKSKKAKEDQGNNFVPNGKPN